MAGPTHISINGRFLAQPVTGVQRYARELLSAIDRVAGEREDIRIRLLTPTVEVALPALRFVRHEAVGRLQGHAWEQLELPRHVGRDVLFCPGNTAPIASLRGRTRVAVTLHDLSYLYFPKAYSWRFRFLYHALVPRILRDADVVITVSESERAAILGHYPWCGNRLVAVQNGSLPDGVDPVSPQPANHPFVLYVGSLSKRKNLPAMLEVATTLAKKRGLRFIFVGGVGSSLIESVIDIDPAVRDHLAFVGQVNEWDALSQYYRSARCFFFPSLYESSGLPPLEAMGCGSPVLAAAIPALMERCGDAALYCNPRSVDDMVAKLERLIDDVDLQRTLREAGYERARLFTWENCARATLEHIVGHVGTAA